MFKWCYANCSFLVVMIFTGGIFFYKCKSFPIWLGCKRNRYLAFSWCNINNFTCRNIWPVYIMHDSWMWNSRHVLSFSLIGSFPSIFSSLSVWSSLCSDLAFSSVKRFHNSGSERSLTVSHWSSIRTSS